MAFSVFNLKKTYKNMLKKELNLFVHQKFQQMAMFC